MLYIIQSKNAVIKYKIHAIVSFKTLSASTETMNFEKDDRIP